MFRKIKIITFTTSVHSLFSFSQFLRVEMKKINNRIIKSKEKHREGGDKED